jgi:hypothetical protein
MEGFQTVEKQDRRHIQIVKGRIIQGENTQIYGKILSQICYLQCTFSRGHYIRGDPLEGALTDPG